MKLVQLKLKKIGNHWYLDVPHNDPRDLIIDPILERFLSIRDKDKEGIITNIYLSEQQDYINEDGLLQFSEKDLLRYFTTNESFKMNIFISNHHFQISSELYTILESQYQLDFHIALYRFVVYEI